MATIEYVEPPKKDKKEEILKLLNRKRFSTVYLSRMRGELVAIVPKDNRDTEGRYWIWLSSAYTDGILRTPENIAKTIILGEWDIQEDVKIQIQDFGRF